MRIMPGIALGLAAIGIAPAPAEAQSGQPAYVGRWAAQPNWCRNRPGTTDELPIKVTARGMEGHEISCRFGRIRGGSPGSWQVSMSCSGEGMTERRTVDLRVEGNTLHWKNAGGAGAAQRFTRCG